MSHSHSRKRLAIIAVIVGHLALAIGHAAAKEFIIGEVPRPAITDDWQNAQIVLLAHAVQCVPEADGSALTVLAVDHVFKSHDAIKGKTTITVKRKIESKSPYLLFCEVTRGKIEPFRGNEVADAGAVKDYILGLFEWKTDDERLWHCFDHLESKEALLASDARAEFAKQPTKELKLIARRLPAEKIAAWLRNPRSNIRHCEFYAFLLTCCGKAEHKAECARLIRSRVDESIASENPDIAGLLNGYLMLQPREGWAYVRSLLGNRELVFKVRFQALQNARFLQDQPDLVEPRELNAGVAQLLEQPEFADLGIDFLCQAKCWERTDQVLAVYKKNDDFANRFITNSVVRFALQSPHPRAAAFVRELRSQEPDLVRINEELLKLEAEAEMK